ncbi:hypothetical protein ACQYWQ_06195 [Streptomyces sp. P6-2-1]|uniref:hypothetical protein n=1 Tax=Streptomyces sp. P6-2-1 TaxID=3422591 RepID=UPI003D36D84A
MATTETRKHVGGRWRVAWPLLAGVLLLVVGGGMTAVLPARIADASALDGARPCAASVAEDDTGADCLHPVRLTVASVKDVWVNRSETSRRVDFVGRSWSGAVDFRDDSRFGKEVAEDDHVSGFLWHDALVGVTWAGKYQESRDTPRSASTLATGVALGGLTGGLYSLVLGVRRLRRGRARSAGQPADTPALVAGTVTTVAVAALLGVGLGGTGLAWWWVPLLWAVVMTPLCLLWRRYRAVDRATTLELPGR